jgi:hypothetical protein
MSSLLNSLLLDNSSTVCAIGLNLLVSLCPVFAVEACEHLKSMLPTLLVILARILCWKERPPSHYSTLDQDGDKYTEVDDELDQAMVADAEARPNIGWERLDMAFRTTTSSAPPLRRYFTILYYLFPCNVLIFLRTPIAHLTHHQVKCPFDLDWEDAFDEDEIRSKSEVSHLYPFEREAGHSYHSICSDFYAAILAIPRSSGVTLQLNYPCKTFGRVTMSPG